ncbi:serine hydrolase [uncultured Aquimarina sp.]|uniref:serine hydrolase n=1 Tax=uncultured Aquimarina sp. TaxID=575652 RepID=UPI00260F2C80|nr:serine hydrolase [uncultured Aquimarina sp.]
MNLSGVERKSNYPINRAKGYRKTTFGIKNEENIVSYALGTGDIFSTVEDLYKWDQALYENRLLSQESKKLLFDGENEEFGNYGYGFRIAEYQRGKGNMKNGILMRHGGTMDGFMSNVHRYSDDKLTVIILGNMRTFPIRQMTRELKEIVLEIKPEDRIHSTHE